MANTKITDLTALTGANLATGDQFVAVDVSDTTMAASGTDKKMTAAELLNGLSAIGGVQVVNHGATAGTARPTGAVRILWIGSVAPTNGVAGDEWRDTTLNATRFNVGGVWFYPPGLELGYAERTTSDTTTNTARASTSTNLISGLTLSGIVGTGQPVDIEFYSYVTHSVAATFVGADLVINSTGNTYAASFGDAPQTTSSRTLILRRRQVLTAGTSYTFDIGKWVGAAGTGTYVGGTTNPMHLSVTSR